MHPPWGLRRPYECGLIKTGKCDTNADTRHHTTLTRAIADTSSPLRRYMDQSFPHTGPLRKEFQAGAQGILVEAGSSNPGTIGTAFDLMMRFRIHPRSSPSEPLRAIYALSGHSVALRFFGPRAIRGVIHEAQVAAGLGDTRSLARACWSLALATEVYRAGVRLPGSPLVQLMSVKGQGFLPGGGHETCPVTDTSSARWWPRDLPKGAGHQRTRLVRSTGSPLVRRVLG